MIAAAGPTPLWYATRSSGYVSLLLLTVVVVLGITASLRWQAPPWPRFAVQALHRNLSLLALAFVALHVVTAVADPFAGITVLNSVVPFTGSYRPVWLGLGVVSLEVVAALVVTSLLRAHLSFRLWRVVHLAAYASWPLALLHTLGTGSDQRAAWGLLTDLGCLGAVAAALLWRMFSARSTMPPASRLVALITALAAAVAVLTFATTGPLRAGWAQLAGTPPQLLATRAGAPPAPAAGLVSGISDSVSGTAQADGQQVLVNLGDSRDPNLHLLLALGRQREELTVTEGSSTICAAPASFDGTGFIASCGALQVALMVTQDTGGTVSGLLVTSSGVP